MFNFLWRMPHSMYLRGARDLWIKELKDIIRVSIYLPDEYLCEPPRKEVGSRWNTLTTDSNVCEITNILKIWVIVGIPKKAYRHWRYIIYIRIMWTPGCTLESICCHFYFFFNKILFSSYVACINVEEWIFIYQNKNENALHCLEVCMPRQ